jgi:hypothetical protein
VWLCFILFYHLRRWHEATTHEHDGSETHGSGVAPTPHQHFPVLFVSMIPLAYSSARGATIFVLPYFLLFTYTYTHTHPHTFYLPIRPVHRISQSKHPIAALLLLPTPIHPT